jgi:hypothetical protein
MKPLVFPTVPSPGAKVDGPKPLPFAPEPPAVAKEKSQPLFAGYTPPNVPAAKAPSHIPGAVFQQTNSIAVQAVMDELKKSHSDLFLTEGAKLEREVAQLVPLDIARVMNWAATYVAAMGDVSGEVSHIVRSFTAARGAELIAETLKALTQKPTFLSKLIHETNISTRPQLFALRSQLQLWISETVDLEKRVDKVRVKLITKMTSLRVVADMCGNPKDTALSDALYERQLLIAQATTQIQITAQQLTDVRRQIADQLSRIDQLVNITIPAYNSANSSS